MANWKKLASGAAGAAGGAGLNVEDVFSTYLYTGAQGVDNGIDLHNEGGLVWIKSRASANHALFDTERGIRNVLVSNNTSAQYYDTNTLTAFSHDGAGGTGFFASADAMTGASGVDYASWTFRKAPKFFDVVTYTGNSTAGRTVSHNLGTDVGFMVIKNTTSSGDWICWHRSASTDPGRILKLNATDAVAFNSAMLNNTNPTSTEFTVGTNFDTNGSGQTYVAYLFAHNNSDGDFGPTGDQDIIKCGSYTGNGSNTGPIIDLGFEPQWLLIKSATTVKEWRIHDVMRGMPVGGSGAYLQANSSAAESTDSGPVAILPNGFQLSQGGSETNASGVTYIYIAIRRGPMAVPTSGTDVFVTRYRGEDTVSQPPMFYSGWPVDMAFQNNDITSSTSNHRFSTRLTGHHYLVSSSTAAESTGASSYTWDYMDGWVNATGTVSNYRSWMWRRAPNFFDVVAWKGSSASTRTLNHNLGIAPEMIWAKNRNDTDPWYCYHTATGNTKSIPFSTSTPVTSSAIWNNTTPSATTFSVGNNLNWSTSFNYIAYLFATVAGVSKVGSYTGTSASQTIDCGFSSGARFVLIKEISGAGNWYLFDTERGITSTSNDGVLQLNSTAAELSESAYGYDMLQPHNSGFTLTAAGNAVNFNGADFIFYAIA